MSSDSSPHSVQRDWDAVALAVQNTVAERNRVDGLAALERLEEQLEAACAERDRISREAVGAVLKWSDRAEKAEAALQELLASRQS